jgi:NAD(P)-dependent dehydrogenase (short-subunit alcohol dehydrogenase family)
MGLPVFVFLVAALAILIGAMRTAFMRIPHKELDWDTLIPMARESFYRENGTDRGLPLKGLVAVVTGATNGIGLSITRALTRKLGASVVAVGRSETKLQKLKNEFGDAVVTVRADFVDLYSVSRAADEIAMSFDSIDVLINNAGISYPSTLTFNATELETMDGFDRLFVTNYLSHVLLTEKLLPELYNSTARRPTIMQVTSNYHWLADGSDLVPASEGKGQVGGPLASRPGGAFAVLNFRGARAYANSKLGQLYHARSLQKRHPTLRVVSVCPSWVGTNILGGEGIPEREIMMKLGYRVDDWGISSALYALFVSSKAGEDFFTNTAYFEFLKGISNWMPRWASSVGVRDAFVNVVAFTGLIGQHFFSRAGPTRSSPESYDMEKAEALWEWSYRTLSKYLPA